MKGLVEKELEDNDFEDEFDDDLDDIEEVDD